jgi:isopentenyldiphosphate isomerase/intracellular septation protein A
MIDRQTILRNLAVGFLPILVFILADLLFGLTTGLIVAIFAGIVQFIFTFIREKQVDKFILFDVLLISFLGVISLALQDDIFFKLKPALIEGILVILLGVTAFSDNPIILRMSSRYMKGVEFSDQQIIKMRNLMKRMFYIIFIHIILILFSAFYMSTAAWGFVSGGLFYIILVIYMGFEFIRTKIQRKRILSSMESEEWFDLVTPAGKVVGKAPRSLVHGNPDLLHSVVHVHLINEKGMLYLQKRAPTKDLYPGYWDTAIGGHIQSGETIEQALQRESEEELGLSMVEFKPLFRYVHKNAHESELVHSFYAREDGPFFINRQEISEGKFWQIEEIEKKLGEDFLTPNFEEEFVLLKKVLFSRQKKGM